MAQELAEGAIVLATVATVNGSTPREAGAKMIVCADGRIMGTIGGGAGEAKVCRQAIVVLRSGEKQFVEVDLSGAPWRETQGVCGGRMQVWLERWSEDALPLVNQILSLLHSGQTGALVTPFSLAQSPHLLQSIDAHLPALQVDQYAMIEALVAPPVLMIVGAGHIAVPLAQVAQLAGFQIVVIDDRPEFACGDRFPAGATILASVDAALEALPPTPDLYVTLVTRSYQHDLQPLKMLLQRQTAYIGMIGSQKRIQLVHQALLQAGYSPQVLQTIHAPIGLDIGALTPAEIAVSICAELIQVRRGGTGRSLAAMNRPIGDAQLRAEQLD